MSSPPRRTRREFLRTAVAVSGTVAARSLLPSLPAFAADVAVEQAADEPDLAPLEAQVCIIGSGPAGAILGTHLAARGVDTLIVESGPPHGSSSASAAALDAYSAPGELSYPVASSRFRGAGGTSNLWSGTCPRFHPLDFEPNGYTPRGAVWPIRYGDLEPFYDRAERELSVAGTANTPFAPPHAASFPLPDKTHTPNLQWLIERSGLDMPLQQLPFSYRNHRAVNVAESHLPTFSASPHGTLVCGQTATQILLEPGGRVVGIRLEGLGQTPRIARAQIYVVACGGIETARLLLLSRGAGFPDGVGNHSDLVGRCFMEHPISAIASGWVRGWWNPWSRVEHAISERFLVEAKQQGLGGVRLWLFARFEPPEVDWHHPLQGLSSTAQATRRLRVEVKAQIEMEPSLANRIALTDSPRDALGNTGAALFLRGTENDYRTIRYSADLTRRILKQLGAEEITARAGMLSWDHHHMGTCRMGDDPSSSVVDRDLRVHGVDNLYVAGSAPFVTGSVSNPTLTIVALSLRLADHLREKLRT